MDYYELGFEQDNADFSISDEHNVPSAKPSATSALNIATRNNVLAFPMAKGRERPQSRTVRAGQDRKVSLGEDSDLWARDVFMVCQQDCIAVSAMTELSGSMQSLTVLDQFSPALQLAARCEGSEALLAIDLDVVTDVNATIAQLSKIRKANCALAVLIMSRTFPKSDLHPHHSHVADASLRLPASKYEVSVALHFAVTNTFFRTSCDE